MLKVSENMNTKKLLFIVLILICSFFIWGCSKSKVADLPNQGATVMVNVKSGMNTNDIMNLLIKQGLLPKENSFTKIAKMKNLEKSLQAGSYQFKVGMSEQEIVEILGKGSVFYTKLTIPEGYNVTQIAELIEQEGLGKKDVFLKLAQNYAPYEYMQTKNANIKFKSEGFLYPATYYIGVEMKEAEILKLLVDEFDRKINKEIREKLKVKKMDIQRLIILASLVEKEAQVAEERKVVASVFENRIKQEMPLQSCATIQYILGYPKEELSIADTKIQSPYNTYINSGLPPGPIANPGMPSILAALDPEKTEYLYFVVSSGGKHTFSTNYEDHLRAIK